MKAGLEFFAARMDELGRETALIKESKPLIQEEHISFRAELT